MSFHTKVNSNSALATFGENSDTDTGVSFPAANQVGLMAGGSNVVTATATGATITGTLAAATVTASNTLAVTSNASVTGSLTVTGEIRNFGGSYRSPEVAVASIVSSVAASTTPVTYFTNPYASAVVVPRVWVYVQTACSSASGKISLGSVSAATVTANSLIDSLNLAATGLYNNQVNSSTNGKAVGQVVPASQFITGSVVNGDITSAAGYVYVEYFPI